MPLKIIHAMRFLVRSRSTQPTQCPNRLYRIHVTPKNPINPGSDHYSKAYNYLNALKRRGYNPRQRGWGRCSLTNCPHIFGLYYKSSAFHRCILPRQPSCNTQRPLWFSSHLTPSTGRILLFLPVNSEFFPVSRTDSWVPEKTIDV